MAMEVSELLLQLSEIAVAFAGFSGVVAALGKSIEWDDKARFRFQNLLVISIATIFLALIPLGLLAYETPHSMTWQIASIAMIAGSVAFFVFRAPVARRLEVSDTRDLTLRFVGLTFLVSFVTVVVLQMLGIAGIIDNSAAYLTGLLIFLFLSALQFAVLSMGAVKG